MNILRNALLCALVTVFVCAGAGRATYIGSLSSPSTNGLVSGGVAWAAGEEGFMVKWTVSQNPDFTWHYKYEFFDQEGEDLSMLVSHFIITVSEGIGYDEIYNISNDVAELSISTFGPSPSNPNFPVGQTMYGAKFDLDNAQLFAEFDSTRVPMWGDFYAKDGGNPKNYAYNVDFGVDAVNYADFTSAPVDAEGNVLAKVLVPDTETQIPEPATLLIFSLGGVLLRRKTS